MTLSRPLTFWHDNGLWSRRSFLGAGLLGWPGGFVKDYPPSSCGVFSATPSAPAPQQRKEEVGEDVAFLAGLERRDSTPNSPSHLRPASLRPYAHPGRRFGRSGLHQRRNPCPLP